MVDVGVEGQDVLLDHDYIITEDGEIPGCSYSADNNEACHCQSGIPMALMIEDEAPLNPHGKYDRACKGIGKSNDAKKPRTRKVTDTIFFWSLMLEEVS